MSVSNRGWGINLSGSSISIYGGSAGWTQQGSKIGTLTANECFAEGSAFGSGSGWEGWGTPIYFKNSSGAFVQGAIGSTSGLQSFGEYASNGTSWNSVSTLKRLVKYATNAYHNNGDFCKALPANSYVWLTSSCTRGQKNPNYIAVTKIQPLGEAEFSFKDNGFVDLVNDKWINVGSILLRKA